MKALGIDASHKTMLQINPPCFEQKRIFADLLGCERKSSDN
jgi:hypothetical protein